jgi:hypothetical protein
VRYDPLSPAAYSLHGLITRLRPDDDIGYPLCVETVWLLAQLYGELGRYQVSVDLVRVGDDDAADDDPVKVYGLGPARVREGQFVEGVRFRLTHVPFPTAGLYEFRLTLEGFPEPLATERVLLEA